MRIFLKFFILLNLFSFNSYAGDIYLIKGISSTWAGISSFEENVNTYVDIIPFVRSLEYQHWQIDDETDGLTSWSTTSCENFSTSIYCKRTKTFYDKSRGKEISVDYPSQQVYSIRFFQSDCGSNGDWDSDSLSCNCDIGYSWDNDTSSCAVEHTCDEGKEYDSFTNSCMYTCDEMTDEYVTQAEMSCAASVGGTFQDYTTYNFSMGCSTDTGITSSCSAVEPEPDPDAGDTTDPDAGDTTDPDAGDTTDPDAGDTTDPDAGDTTDPDAGDTTDPDAGDTTDPDAGDNVDPGVGLSGFGSSDSQNLKDIKDNLSLIDYDSLNNLGSDITASIDNLTNSINDSDNIFSDSIDDLIASNNNLSDKLNIESNHSKTIDMGLSNSDGSGFFITSSMFSSINTDIDNLKTEYETYIDDFKNSFGMSTNLDAGEYKSHNINLDIAGHRIEQESKVLTELLANSEIIKSVILLCAAFVGVSIIARSI